MADLTEKTPVALHYSYPNEEKVNPLSIVDLDSYMKTIDLDMAPHNAQPEVPGCSGYLSEIIPDEMLYTRFLNGSISFDELMREMHRSDPSVGLSSGMVDRADAFLTTDVATGDGVGDDEDMSDSGSSEVSDPDYVPPRRKSHGKRLSKGTRRLTIELSQYLGEAERCLNNDAFDEAEQICQNILDSAPNTAAPYVVLAEVCYRRGELDKSREHLFSATQRNPRDADLWSALIDFAEERDDLASAIYYSRLAVRSVKHDVPLRTRLIDYYERAGRSRDALLLRVSALSLSPESNGDAQFNLARSFADELFKLMDRAGSLRAYEAAFEHYPEHGTNSDKNSVLAILFQLDRYEDALKFFLHYCHVKVISDSGNPLRWDRLPVPLSKPEKYISCTYPDDMPPELYLKLFLVLVRLKLSHTCSAHILASFNAEIMAKFDDWLLDIVKAHRTTQLHAESVALIRKLTEMEPTRQSSNVWVMLAETLVELGKIDEAIETYRHVTEVLSPRHEEARVALSNLLKRAGQHEAALELLKPSNLARHKPPKRLGKRGGALIKHATKSGNSASRVRFAPLPRNDSTTSLESSFADMTTKQRRKGYTKFTEEEVLKDDGFVVCEDDDLDDEDDDLEEEEDDDEEEECDEEEDPMFSGSEQSVESAEAILEGQTIDQIDEEVVDDEDDEYDDRAQAQADAEWLASTETVSDATLISHDPVAYRMAFERCRMLDQASCEEKFIDEVWSLLFSDVARLCGPDWAELAVYMEDTRLRSRLMCRLGTNEHSNYRTPEPRLRTKERNVNSLDIWRLFLRLIDVLLARMPNTLTWIETAATWGSVLPAVYNDESRRLAVNNLLISSCLMGHHGTPAFVKLKDMYKKWAHKSQYWNALNMAINFSRNYRHCRHLDRMLCKDAKSIPMGIMSGNDSIVRGSYRFAIARLIILREVSPNDPLLFLLLCVSFLGVAQHKFIASRHPAVLQALGFLSEYREARGPCQEVYYNFARFCHQLQLGHMAVHYYEKVLNMEPIGENEEEKALTDIRPEAAFNLCQLYRSNGNNRMAHYYIQKYLII